MSRRVHDDPPLDFNDVARNQWDAYVESKIDHHYDAPAKPGRKRVRPEERPMQRHEDGLLLYLRTHGH